MNYSNHDTRVKPRDLSGSPHESKEFLSLERGRHGLCLRLRTAATMARRKFEPYRLPVVAALAAVAFLAPIHEARAQLGYDPFGTDLSHSEEKWAPYTTAALDGTNRPVSTTVNGVTPVAANGASFNISVTAPNPNSAFLTSGGNIYSPGDMLTLTLTSTYAPAVGSFNTIVFSIKTLGSPLDAAGVLLTPNGGTAIAPRYSSIKMSGSGMGAMEQSAFQFDLSGLGGSNDFSITIPGSASSVSFSSAQLDASSTAYGTQSVVPEPSSVIFMAVAFGGLSLTVLRRHRLN